MQKYANKSVLMHLFLLCVHLLTWNISLWLFARSVPGHPYNVDTVWVEKKIRCRILEIIFWFQTCHKIVFAWSILQVEAIIFLRQTTYLVCSIFIFICIFSVKHPPRIKHMPYYHKQKIISRIKKSTLKG